MGVLGQGACDAATKRPLGHEVELADPRQRVPHHRILSPFSTTNRDADARAFVALPRVRLYAY